MSGRSILLVEDNAGDVRLTREALREADVSRGWSPSPTARRRSHTCATRASTSTRCGLT